MFNVHREAYSTSRQARGKNIYAWHEGTKKREGGFGTGRKGDRLHGRHSCQSALVCPCVSCQRRTFTTKTADPVHCHVFGKPCSCSNNLRLDASPTLNRSGNVIQREHVSATDVEQLPFRGLVLLVQAKFRFLGIKNSKRSRGTRRTLLHFTFLPLLSREEGRCTARDEA